MDSKDGRNYEDCDKQMQDSANKINAHIDKESSKPSK